MLRISPPPRAARRVGDPVSGTRVLRPSQYE
jgi:hypothetical protein